MPKASKEDTMKVKLQARALFELGKHTQEQICETIKKNGGSLSRKTLAKWISEDPNDVWKINNLIDNKVYNNIKIEQKEKILNEFIKTTPNEEEDIIRSVANEEAGKEATEALNLEAERNKLMQELIDFRRETMEYLRTASRQAMDVLKKGRTSITVSRGTIVDKKFIAEGKAVLTSEEIKPAEYAKVFDILLKAACCVGSIDIKPPKNLSFDNINKQGEQSDLKDINEEESAIIQKVEQDNKNDNFANLCRVINH